MNKYDRLINVIKSYKKDNSISSQEVIIMSSIVESVLADKLCLDRVLKLEGSVWFCSKTVYEFIALNCNDEITTYLIRIMPPDKDKASKYAKNIYEKYQVGEELQIKCNDQYNTIRIRKRMCNVGMFIEFFEDLAKEKGLISRKLVNK